MEFSITVSAVTWSPVKKLDTPFYCLDPPMILCISDDKFETCWWRARSVEKWSMYGVVPMGRYPEENHTIYEVLVWPTFEYATCAWSPYTKTDIQKVEQVQCSNLMWDTLHTRRCIHHGQVHINLSTIIVTSTRSMFAQSQCGIRSSRKQSLYKW